MLLVEEFTTKKERASMTRIADLVVTSGNFFLLEFLINMCFVILTKLLKIDNEGSLALMSKIDELFLEVHNQRMKSEGRNDPQ